MIINFKKINLEKNFWFFAGIINLLGLILTFFNSEALMLFVFNFLLTIIPVLITRIKNGFRYFLGICFSVFFLFVSIFSYIGYLNCVDLCSVFSRIYSIAFLIFFLVFTLFYWISLRKNVKSLLLLFLLEMILFIVLIHIYLIN